MYFFLLDKEMFRIIGCKHLFFKAYLTNIYE